ncbi:AAA family ATPase [Limibacterium fermenti]|uniref:ATP-binding protein n=1 Tax=Limibacterium fermenti TaxID=3229863 RepID=UPI003A77AB59
MSYKISNLILENFAKYAKVEVSFDENVTYLAGVNGSGKSTIGVNGIWFMFQGIAEKSSGGNHPLLGERFRFIGPSSATARGEMTLIDNAKGVEIKVIRRLSKSGSTLAFEAPEGYNLDQQFLNDLFNVFLIAPKKFLELNTKQQAVALAIDTTSYDNRIKELKGNATLLNRDMKQYDNLQPVEETKEADVRELQEKRNGILRFNEAQDERQRIIDRADLQLKNDERTITDIEEQIASLQAKLSVAKNERGEHLKIRERLPKPEAKKNTTEIEAEIVAATDTNRKAFQYRVYVEQSGKKEKLQKEIDGNKKKISEAETERLAYIKSANLPFKNLSFDEEGGLLFDGKPLKEPYFSTGELLKIIPILMTSRNPELKYIFLQDWGLLDEDKQEEIESYLTGRGYQLVIEYVSKHKPEGKHSILLKDNRVVENYEEEIKEEITI